MIGVERTVDIGEELVQLARTCLTEKREQTQVLHFIVFILFISSELFRSFIHLINGDSAEMMETLKLASTIPELQTMQVVMHRQSKNTDESMYVADILESLYSHYFNHLANNQEICREMVDALMFRIPEITRNQRYTEWILAITEKHILNTKMNNEHVWEWKRQCKLKKTASDNAVLVKNFRGLMESFKLLQENDTQLVFFGALLYCYSSGWRGSADLLLAAVGNRTLFRSMVACLFHSNVYFPRLFLKHILAHNDLTETPEIFIEAIYNSIEVLEGNEKWRRWLLNLGGRILRKILFGVRRKFEQAKKHTVGRIPHYDLVYHYFPKVNDSIDRIAAYNLQLEKKVLGVWGSLLKVGHRELVGAYRALQEYFVEHLKRQRMCGEVLSFCTACCKVVTSSAEDPRMLASIVVRTVSAEYDLAEEKRAELENFDANAVLLFHNIAHLQNIDREVFHSTLKFVIDWKLHLSRISSS